MSDEAATRLPDWLISHAEAPGSLLQPRCDPHPAQKPRFLEVSKCKNMLPYLPGVVVLFFSETDAIWRKGAISARYHN